MPAQSGVAFENLSQKNVANGAQQMPTNSQIVERPENGQDTPRLQRRPSPADASPGTTPVFFHSHTLGLSGAETAPKIRGSSHTGPTLNGYHDNGPTNNPTTLAIAAGKRRGGAWGLPALIRPLPVRQRKKPKQPRLLPHFPALVEFVYNHRWATGEQVQMRFPERPRCKRTRQYQLANLVQLGYLALAPVRSTSPNFDYVYCTTAKGIRLIRETYEQRGLEWAGMPTESRKPYGMALDSILHELLLTEFDLDVWRTLGEREDIRHVMHERRYFRKEKQLTYVHNGRTCRVKPDSGILVRYPVPTPRLLLHFIELDNGTLSSARTRQKYRLYDAWSRSTEGESYLRQLFHAYGSPNQEPTWRLLMIAHDKNKPGGDSRRLLDLFTQTLELPTAMRERVWLTTAENLQAAHESPAPLAAPIWLRARDARPWMGEYRAYMARLPKGRGQKPFAAQRKFVSERLSQLPLHSLFLFTASQQTA